MKPSTSKPAVLASLVQIIVLVACSFPSMAASTAVPTTAPILTDMPTLVALPTQTEMPTATSSPAPTVEPPTPTAMAVSHSLIPATSVKTGKLIYDVTSVDTAVEKRTPYGDTYKNNLFERPFMQDMTYVPELDIISYNLSQDEKFYYVSIELVGANPNNALGINYAVELDLDADGYGDTIIVAHPPYKVDWSTENVQVAQDTDHDTGGLSAENSDAPLPGNGYDKIVFDGGLGDDHDLAWVRVNAGKRATVQFAFKLSLAGSRFVCGVLTDAGLKDITSLDYVDRFTEAEAGSPETSNANYPLKAIYGVDNVCREAIGFVGTGEEPQRCPKK